MKKTPALTRTLLSLAISALGMPMAAQAALSFSTAPAGSATKEPAPNVIVSVDNSGSMGTDGIKALKDALKATFDPGFIEDGRIRLAYQAMWGCSGNSKTPSFDPSKDNSCGAFVPMAPLTGSSTAEDGSHRRKFFKWIETLKDGSNTPTHMMMHNAGEYLKVTGDKSPWNAVPGTADSKPIACRRAYHILMTDGGWNYYNDMPMFSGETAKAIVEIFDQNLDNVDGTQKTLPDGVIYDPASAESRVYKDSWGRQTVDAGGNGIYWKGSNGKEYSTEKQCKDVNNNNNCKKYDKDYNYTWYDVVPTLSDMAFHYWSTDLQPGLKSSDPLKNVQPIIKKSGDENFSANGKSQILSEYWNPKNNPATWRHMTTFTIGFNNAATWPTIPSDPVFGTNTFDGDFNKLVVGDKIWINPIQPNLSTPKGWYLNKTYTDKYASNKSIEDPRQQELWHIALNSRGKFFPAKTADDLKAAFGDILKNIVEDTTKPITSYSASSSSVISSSAYLYRAGYDANGWKGYIESFKIAKGTGAGSANTGWGGATDTTATKLDAASVTAANRKIYTAKSDTGSVIPFLFDSLHADQQALFKKTGETNNTLATNRINFIRGDLEVGTTAKPFRSRSSRHGDIVNSALWYVGAPAGGFDLPGYSAFSTAKKSRTPMLYVGANDGMLHGFSAADGTEKIAYIPQGLLKKLPALTEPGYTHQYYVDGSPFTGDVDTGSSTTPAWKTMLAGSLGAGGKGYFVLDVTNPGSATDLVITDQTSSTDADIGHIFGPPVPAEFNPQRSLQIAKMNNDRWALISGNGYNSTNGRPVLLIQYLSGSDTSLLKIEAASSGANATDNGLSTPRPVDLNGDGTVDVVYAGDLKGNMWKFDVSNKASNNWSVAFSGDPLYIAKDSTDTRQPITSAPNVRTNKSVGGMMVAFGTGRNVTDGDRSDRASVHTVYSVLDETKYTLDSDVSNEGKVKAVASPAPTTVSSRTSATAHGDLVPRTFNATNINGEGRSSDEVFWNMSDTQVELKYAGTGKKRGWYLDLPADGERVLTMPTFYDGSNVLDITSEIPASGGNTTEESCSPPAMEGKQYQTLMGIEFGLRPTVQLLDSNGDGLFNAAADQDNKTNRHTTDPGKAVKVNGGFNKLTGKETCTNAGDCKAETSELPKPPLTINWRQLQ